jgi:hypothetical protein
MYRSAAPSRLLPGEEARCHRASATAADPCVLSVRELLEEILAAFESADQKSCRAYCCVGPSSRGHSANDRSRDMASIIIAVAIPRPA